MKFWLDAQLPPAICDWLRDHFDIQATPVRELGLTHASDVEIFLKARREGVVVVSKDADFADLVRRRGSPPQVLWVTCGNVTNRGLRAFLEATLSRGLDMLEEGEPLVRLTEVSATD